MSQKKIIKLLWPVLLLSSSATPALAREDLSTVVGLGLGQAMEIKVEGQKLEKSSNERWNSWAKLLPTLSLSGGRSLSQSESYSSGAIVKGSDWAGTMYASAAWKIWDNTENITAIQKEALAHHTQEVNLKAKTQEYIINLLDAYLNYEILIKKVKISEERVKENTEILDQAKELVTLGLKTKMEILDSEIQVFSSQNDLDESKAARNSGERTLLFLLNQKSMENVSHVDILTVRPYFLDLFKERFPPFRKSWSEIFSKSNPDMIKMQDTLESSRLDRRLSRMGYFPRLDVNLTEQWDFSRKVSKSSYPAGENGALKSTSLVFSLTWTLWDWWITPNNISNQDKTFEITHMEFLKGREGLEKDLKGLIEQYDLNEMRIATAKLVMQKSKLYQYHTLERYKLGRLTRMELQRAINQYFEAQNNLSSIIKDQFITMAKLIYYMGEDLVPPANLP